MILPAMGVISEIITCFSRKKIYRLSLRGVFERGDRRVGFSGVGHHMFVAGKSVYAALVFSLLSFVVAIPRP